MYCLYWNYCHSTVADKKTDGIGRWNDLQERIKALEEAIGGKRGERDGRRWITTDCLTKLDDRMTAQEQTCLSALRDLEAAVNNEAQPIG